MEKILRLLQDHGCPPPEETVLKEWEAGLTARPHPWKQRLLRKHLSPILARVPGPVRLALTSAIKSMRNRKRRFPVREESSPIDVWLRENAPTPPAPTFCLTADVDNRLGYDWLDQYIEITEAAGVRLTMLMVTHYDYKPDLKWLEGLEKRGIEVGLHCYDHDIGLAYRSPAKIEKKLTKALERLPPAVSYRSAALSLSETLLNVVAKLGIRIDSSTSSHCHFYPVVPTTQPYRYGTPDIVEVPLVLQDDYFFRDVPLSDTEALKKLDEILPRLAGSGSNCMINFHPHNMRKRPTFLKEAIHRFQTHYPAGSRLMKDYLPHEATQGYGVSL